MAVTGEEYVLLNLLEVLLSLRGTNESMRSTFLRARDSGALDEIPGLVYSRSTARNGAPEELVDTGIQRLLGDLDELPHATLGYRLLEPPSTKPTLERHALAENRVRAHCLISSIVMTVGCKFRCSYCPIPAYNQRQYRVKSGERIADEMGQIAESFGIINFFGTDDNFFNNTERTLEIAETLARKVSTGQRPYCKIRYGTEATVHDTIRLKEHLPVIRQSGLRALWMGVEDITASLVQEGAKRRQDAGVISPVAGQRDLSHSHDDASRLAAAGILEKQLRTAQPTEDTAQGWSTLHPGLDADAVARLEVVCRHLHIGMRF